MRLEIIGFDVDNPRHLELRRRIGEAHNASHGVPWRSATAAEQAASMRTLPGLEQRRFIGVVEGDLAAYADVEWWTASNLDKATATVKVLPEHRGEGHEHALLAHLLDVVPPERSEIVLASVSEDDRALREAAAVLGFCETTSEIMSVLDLPLPAETVHRLAAEIAFARQRYTLRSYVDAGMPDDVLSAWLDLERQIAVDAPSGEIEYEAHAITPEEARENLARFLATGQHGINAVALAPGGDVVAMSSLVVRPDPGRPAIQEGTYVRRDHRGHHLGLAVKAEALATLRREFPRVPWICTCNDHDNAPMLAVNHQLGYRRLYRQFTLLLHR